MCRLTIGAVEETDPREKGIPELACGDPPAELEGA